MLSRIQSLESATVVRPFGSGQVHLSGVTGRLQVDPDGLRCTPRWSHIYDVPIGTDIRDGLTRPADTADWTYADGDEIQLGSRRYVVVWAEDWHAGTPQARRRLCLLRC